MINLARTLLTVAVIATATMSPVKAETSFLEAGAKFDSEGLDPEDGRYDGRPVLMVRYLTHTVNP